MVQQAGQVEEEDDTIVILWACLFLFLMILATAIVMSVGSVLWTSSPPATQATASAYLVNESAAAGGEVALISLNVTSYANETLSLHGVYAYVGLSNGTVEAVALQTRPNSTGSAGPATIVLAPNGQLQLLLEPKGSASFYLSLIHI